MSSKNSVEWRYFPPVEQPNDTLRKVIDAFEARYESIRSDRYQKTSNEVLAELQSSLKAEGFQVETGKTHSEKVRIDVLLDGKLLKYFEVDAFHKAQGIVLEVEAGRGVENNQFLKDIFEACMMDNVHYLVIGVRKIYSVGHKRTPKLHFKTVTDKFLRVLYASPRLKLPLQGILTVGY